MNIIALRLKCEAELGNRFSLEEFENKLNSLSRNEILAICEKSIIPTVRNHFEYIFEENDGNVDFDDSQVVDFVKEDAKDLFFNALCELDGDLGEYFEELSKSSISEDEWFEYLFKNVWQANQSWLECASGSDGGLDNLETMSNDKNLQNQEVNQQEKSELEQQFDSTSPEKR